VAQNTEISTSKLNLKAQPKHQTTFETFGQALGWNCLFG